MRRKAEQEGEGDREGGREEGEENRMCLENKSKIRNNIDAYSYIKFTK